MDELTRRQKALIASLATRHGRRKEHLCLCEGVRCCRELFEARPDLVRFTVMTDRALPLFSGCPGQHYVVGEEEMARLSATVNSQGILAVADVPADAPADQVPQVPFLPAMDQVSDPGNFGTICRTARAAGLDTLWYTAGSADPYSDKVIRSALGAHFAMKLRCFPTLEALRQEAAAKGFERFYISTPHDGTDCFEEADLFRRSVVVIGSEARGAEMLPGALHVQIPMPGRFESLNAAQAATILLFESVRRSRNRS